MLLDKDTRKLLKVFSRGYGSEECDLSGIGLDDETMCNEISDMLVAVSKHQTPKQLADAQEENGSDATPPDDFEVYDARGLVPMSHQLT